MLHIIRVTKLVIRIRIGKYSQRQHRVRACALWPHRISLLILWTEDMAVVTAANTEGAAHVSTYQNVQLYRCVIAIE